MSGCSGTAAAIRVAHKRWPVSSSRATANSFSPYVVEVKARPSARAMEAIPSPSHRLAGERRPAFRPFLQKPDIARAILAVRSAPLGPATGFCPVAAEHRSVNAADGMLPQEQRDHDRNQQAKGNYPGHFESFCGEIKSQGESFFGIGQFSPSISSRPLFSYGFAHGHNSFRSDFSSVHLLI